VTDCVHYKLDFVSCCIVATATSTGCILVVTLLTEYHLQQLID